MSGIYQLNQPTDSVILPVSGNTFIGTSDNSELYTVDSAGNVTIYGTGSGGSIDTGSFAVTASNSFTGSQTISGSVEITGPLNTIHTSGLLSQSIVDIIDEDLSPIFPAYNIASGSVNGFSLNSGSNSPAIFVGTTHLTNINGVTGGILNGAAISLSSGSTACSVGLQKTTGGVQTQLYYNPDYAGGNESYIIQVGDTGGAENRLIIQKADTLGEGVQLKLSDITEGFVLGHNFSNPSASLFKVRDSSDINTIFDITEVGTIAYRPIGTHNIDFTCSNSGTGYGGHYVRVTGNITCSLQPNSAVSVPTGVEWEFFQTDAAQLHFESASGVTLNSKGGALKLTGQFSAATLKKVGADEWDLIGDLS